MSRMIAPKVSIFCSEPVISAGPINRNTPLNPTTSPRMDSQVGLFPPARNDSNSVSQKGEVAITSAAIPEGTVFSASETNPFPPSSRNVPTMAAAFQLLRVGVASPAIRLHAYRIAPETRNRIEACRNGGRVSTEKRIARYVEPQTM